HAAGLFNFDPDAPLGEQYVEYLVKLVQFDLGESITNPGTTVLSQIAAFLPWTLFSVGSGLLISFALGVAIGTAQAYWRGSAFDNIMTAIASILYGIPDYIIALLLLIVGGVQLGLFQIGELRGALDPGI